MNHLSRPMILIAEKADDLYAPHVVDTLNTRYSCQTVRTIADIVDLIQKQSVDLVAAPQFLDDDGTVFDLLRVIGDETPVIFLANSDETAVAVRALDAGAADYLICDANNDYLLLLPKIIERTLVRQAQSRANQQIDYKKIVFGSPDMVVMYDRNYRYMMANTKYLEIWDQREDELIGKHISDILGQQIFESRAKPNLDRCLAGEVVNYQTWFDFPNYKGCYLDVYSYPIYDGEESVSGIITRLRDLTEQKLIENELRFHSEALSNAAEGVQIVSIPDGRFLYTNTTFNRMFGYEDGELIGQHVSVLNMPADDNPEEVAKKIIETVNRDGYWRGEVYNVRKDGSAFWCRAKVTTFVHEIYGTVWLTIQEDIDEYKRAELELRFHSYALNTLSEAVFYTDINTSSIVYTNQACDEMFGYELGELIGQPITIFNDQNTYSRVEDIKQALHHEGIWSGELDNIRKDGRQFWSRVSIVELEHPVYGRVWLTVQTDVTAEKLANQALLESEERYRRMFELIRLPELVIDPQSGQILDANPAAIEYYGYTRERLQSMTMGQIYQASEDVIQEEVIRVMRGESHSWGFIQQLKNGRLTEAEVYAGVINWGGRTAMYAVHVDVTERNAAERKLRELNQSLEQRVKQRTIELADLNNRLQAIFNNSSDSILLLEPNLTILNTNEATSTFFEFSNDNNLNVNLLSYVVEANRERLIAACGKIKADKNSLQFETTFRRGNALFDGEIALSPILDRSGNVINFVGNIRDITDRKRAERDLRKTLDELQTTQHLLERVFLAMPDAINVFNIVEERQLYGNKRIAQDLGYSVNEIEEMGSQLTLQLTHPDDFHKYRLHQQQVRVITDNEINNLELRMKDKWGEWHWILSRYAVFKRNDQGEPIEILGISQDITDIKEAEEALRKTLERERELGALKSRFVSMASHEFRTPLTTIQSAMETIRAYRDRMTNEQIDQRFKKVTGQILYLKSIMDDVLQLERIQSGRMKFEPERSDFRQVCQEIVLEYQEQPQYAERLHVVMPHEAILLEFDHQLIRQALTNLISNALKYSEVDEPVSLRISETAEDVLVVVQDHGIGIPEEDLGHLFEPFHRASNVGVVRGTGLGLSIAHRAVNAHEGQLTVESKVGIGTTFKVHIPKKHGSGT